MVTYTWPALPLVFIFFSFLGVCALLSLTEIIELLNLLYCFAALLEFAAFVWLRFKRPEIPRPYRVPLSKFGCALMLIPTFAFTIAIMCLAYVHVVVVEQAIIYIIANVDQLICRLASCWWTNLYTYIRDDWIMCSSYLSYIVAGIAIVLAFLTNWFIGLSKQRRWCEYLEESDWDEPLDQSFDDCRDADNRSVLSESPTERSPLLASSNFVLSRDRSALLSMFG